MSILKFANGKNRGKEALKEAIQYIINPEKMPDNLILGNGINLDTPGEDMETVQALFGKKTGRRYIHYIISFDEDVSEKIAIIVAKEAASYYASEYQYVLAIHSNTNNVHAHVLLNAVNIKTGNKFSQSKAEMLKFRSFVNDCLSKYDLTTIGESVGTDLCCKTGELEDWEDWEEFLEDDEMENDNEPSSFFGFADPNEISQIKFAEDHDADMKKIIHYFEGESEELPPNLYYEDAELEYLNWKDAEDRFYERDDENNFFEH